MAPPTWLPTLNSHNQHEICVNVWAENPENHPLQTDPFVWIKTCVTVKFKSDEPTNQRILEGLSWTEGSFTIPFSLLTKPAKFSRLTRTMIDLIYIPFDLSLDCDELSEIIRSTGHSIMQETCRDHYNVLPLTLEISKEVEVPNCEFETWISWYDETITSDPEFETEYSEAISRDRTDEELLYEETRTAATKSSIQELEKLSMDEDGSNSNIDKSYCAICFEELQKHGSKIIRLPCYHMFHGDCVTRWLQESHVCPLCRFALPCLGN
ncbi:hypothetical protein ACH5RR_021230 [Cinchona calisaya]|uniref:RING-type domain-containing protein n=1 Tax=Cinchona calisaya TaxID=153742 RepID=A0ABD2ZGP9_9GENT